MMNSFHNNIVFSPNMRDGGNNVVFDTYIRYNEHSIKTIRGGALVDILEFVEIGSSCFGTFIFTILKKK